MSFAREGLIFIIIAAALALGALVLAFRRDSLGLFATSVVLTVLALWVAWFFRDPDRKGERGDQLVVSPADGRVVGITEVEEPAFVQKRAIRISIFMNIFDVHVNRFPVNGTVTYVHYNEGKFLNAATEKASLDNEQMSVGIELGTTRVLVRQIAGLIARRIVNHTRPGDTAVQGERMGIIRFGSRVDVFVPRGFRVRVKMGDTSKAGTTVLAELAQ